MYFILNFIRGQCNKERLAHFTENCSKPSLAKILLNIISGSAVWSHLYLAQIVDWSESGFGLAAELRHWSEFLGKLGPFND